MITTRPLNARCIWMLAGLIVAAPWQIVLAESPAPSQTQFFEAKIRPLLIEHCYECHSQESGESAGEFMLDTAAAIRRGGTRGDPLSVDHPDASLLLRAIEYGDPDLQMPPSGKLEQKSIELLRQWIEMGAPDPRSGATVESTSPLDRDPKSHWAFVPPHQPSGVLPIDLRSVGCQAQDPIDTFADMRAASIALAPSPPADRQTLIRRLYFDLTGLPPTAAQIEAFVSSDRPDAYARLVDQLLAQPDFGQRFGRHWLDVARYADTLGYTTGGKSREYEGSYRYRDWVVMAFAGDMPYDQMILHQLAADRTDPDNREGNLDAMGFLTLGRQFLNRFDTLDDRIDVISRGLLGMTVTCARCHDHKFDPIPTADYYSFAGIINSSEKPAEPASPLMLADKAKPTDHPILIRGQAGNRGEVVPRQFLTALRKPEEPRFDDGSGRWELAERIIAPDNPLTSRVMVNRIWAHLIGRPLVDSPSDFGFRTEPPRVPEVLDDLAVDFASHWSIKRIVRRIVLSRIYRQSTQRSDAAKKTDPENRYLMAANRRRRGFESMRDSMLMVCGHLDRSMSGPSVELTGVPINPRRALYGRIDRQNLPPIFRTFDFASPDTHAPQRYYTTVPQQALFLMNNDQLLELARLGARQVRHSVSSNSADELATKAFQRILGRLPTAVEHQYAVEFLAEPVLAIEPTVDPIATWSYGTSTIDQDGRPANFTLLTVFKDKRFQPREKFPTDAPFGHAHLSAGGGHTASSKDLAVVRRWTAPNDGRVRIAGRVQHPSDKGDGIQWSVWVGDRKLIAETIRHRKHRFEVKETEIGAGQTISFVATPGESASFDSFRSAARIEWFDTAGRVIEFGTTRDFAGPDRPSPPPPLNRLEQLTQTLLMTNEFVFID